MANPYSSLVTAKLAYTRALLRLEAGQGAGLARTALSQSALLQLHGAWRAYLREVAAGYQLRNVEAVVSAASLCEALQAEGKTPSEARELRDLEADPLSWLAGMLQSVQQIDGTAPTVTAPHTLPAAAVENRIAVATGSSPSAEVDAATVGALMTVFVELVDRQRGTMIEC